MAENFPELLKDIAPQIQEARRLPNRENKKSSLSRYIIVALENSKILREKNKSISRM